MNDPSLLRGHLCFMLLLRHVNIFQADVSNFLKASIRALLRAYFRSQYEKFPEVCPLKCILGEKLT